MVWLRSRAKCDGVYTEERSDEGTPGTESNSVPPRRLSLTR